MNLLGSKLYDPAVAVAKATSSALAMTAIDTTNLRLTVTVPAHGFLRCKLMCAMEGATTFAQILLGVMSGSTVSGRIAPEVTIGGTAIANTRAVAVAEFTISGLTPGSITLDAAYGVEITVASTNIKYGGPNDTTTSNAWGGFLFEIWDPQPQATAAQLAVDANGRVDLGKILGTAVATPATAGILDVNVKNYNNGAAATAAAGIPKVDIDTIKTNAVVNAGTATFPANATLASTTNITAGVITTTTNLTTNNDKTGYGLSAAAIQAIWDALTSALTTVGSIGKLIVTNLDALISSRTKPSDTQARVTLVDTVTTYTGNTPQTGDGFARLGAPVGASISADIAAIPGAVWDVDTTAHLGAPGANTAALNLYTNYQNIPAIATSIEDLITARSDAIDAAIAALSNLSLDDLIEPGVTVQLALQLAAASTGAKISGLANGPETDTVTVRNVGDTADLVVASVDAQGHRLSVAVG
jgi:hypothetical protein